MRPETSAETLRYMWDELQHFYNNVERNYHGARAWSFAHLNEMSKDRKAIVDKLCVLSYHFRAIKVILDEMNECAARQLEVTPRQSTRRYIWSKDGAWVEATLDEYAERLGKTAEEVLADEEKELENSRDTYSHYSTEELSEADYPRETYAY